MFPLSKDTRRIKEITKRAQTYAAMCKMFHKSMNMPSIIVAGFTIFTTLVH